MAWAMIFPEHEGRGMEGAILPQNGPGRIRHVAEPRLGTLAATGFPAIWPLSPGGKAGADETSGYNAADNKFVSPHVGGPRAGGVKGE